MSTKYVSGRVKELKVGVSNYSESKESLSVIGIVSATKYYGDGSNLTGAQIPGVDPSGSSTFNNLKVTGISTFQGDLDIESSVLITGITTIGGLVDINAGGQANTFKVEDLTDNRVVIVGTGGELEDDANLTFNGTQFNVGSGVTIYHATGIVSATKFYGDGSSLTGIDASALKDGGGTVRVQANTSGAVVTGVLTASTFKGALVGNVTGNINGDLTGTLQTAAQPNVTSLGTIASLVASSAKVSDLTSGRVVYAGASGELQDSANLTFNGTTLTANAFAGNGAALTNLPTGITTGGTSDFTTLRVSTLLDVDGHTELDNVNISGVATGTFVGNGAGLTNLNTGITTGGTSDFVNLNLDGTLSVGGTSIFNSPIVGVATFSGAVDVNGGADISGGTGLTASTAKISDLTDNRVVIAGTAGELEDTSKLTFNGSTLAVVGDANFTGNVTVQGTLTSEDKTNIDSIGIITARTGVRVSSGGIIVSSGIATFSDSVVASSAKVSDLTSGRVVVVGTAGELQDASTFTFSGGTVTASAFAGDGSALTGITASGTGAIGGITVKDEGVTVGTAGSVSSFDFRGSYITAIASPGAAGVATVTVSETPSFTNLNVTGISTFNNNVKLLDDDKLLLGTGEDLQIYHNSSNNYDYIKSGTGQSNRYLRVLSEGGFWVRNHGDTTMYFGADTNGCSLYSGGTNRLQTNTSGIVVTGTCVATDFNSTSDIRLKDNIQVIEDPLAKLVQIEGVSFNWKENNKPALGVIADQVQEILPELVTDGDPKTVNYNGLIGLLIEAVKEQQIQIDELKSKLP